MNSRELSEKLEELATRLVDSNDDRLIILQIVEELRALSNQTYAPGNSTTWDAIKPKPTKPTGGFVSKSGQNLPF